jgi:acetylornithine deacetylase
VNTPIAPDAALEAEILSVVEESLPQLQSLLSTLRLGVYPGVTATKIHTAVEERLRHVAASDPRLHGAQYRGHYTGFQAEGLTIDAAHPLMTTLAGAHERVVGTPAQSLASIATTDARVFNLYGDTPATCYGPEATNIHGIDESVSLESTRRVAGAIALFLARWCGVEQA